MENRMKKSIGFVISKKENEKRLAILPNDLVNVKNKKMLYFETGYGRHLLISDQDYADIGCQIVSRERALAQAIICEPKIGDADYLANLVDGQTIFGWIHAAANPARISLLLEKKISSYEWAYIMANERHVFWKNNQLAGEAAVLHAFQLIGRLPRSCRVAVLGRGNSAQGALRILNQLGADVVVYNRNQEALFRQELPQYDVIVNAIMWDNHRTDRIITTSDLTRLKKGTLIIDISSDLDGAIETSKPTTIDDPLYSVAGIIHYAVDHTPTILYQEATAAISAEVANYLDDLVESRQNESLAAALVTAEGQITHELLRV